MIFIDKLNAAAGKNRSLVCVGLDSSPELVPAGMSVLDFNRAIIDATADLVCAYKPNIAFYEAQGEKGLDTLHKTIVYVPKDIPVIIDAKRGDIGNTAQAYAKALFEYMGCDAVTVSPYLGFDSLEPFLNYQEKGVIIICRTSNKGSSDFQSLPCQFEGKTMPLYEIVALKASRWNTNKNIGLVVGATYPEELKNIRQAHPDIPILIPGVGAQGGDLELSVRYGVDTHNRGVIINSSRGIIYAGKGADFAIAARKAAQTLRDEINKVIAGMKKE
ncbi:MAG: orotidine-5'-phosphate decarboxylase [Dehalococcoidales bacterium]